MVLQRGDAIERQGPATTMHRGIFAGLDLNGRPWVIHNAKNDQVKWDLLEIFAEGQQISLFRRVAKNIQDQNRIIARAHSLVGTKFDLLSFNCDHLVTYALAGAATSPQLQFVASIMAIVAFGGFIAAAGRA